MKKALTIGFLFMAIILFSGCAAKSYIPLSESYRNKVISSDFVILQTQNEIVAEVEKSNAAAAMGGGLIWALVDAYYENKNATETEDFIQPIRNLLLNYQVEENLNKELPSILNNTSWFNSKSLKLVQNEEEKLLDQLLITTSSDALGIIKPTYGFDSNFLQLEMKMEFTLYPASKTTKNQETHDEKDHTPLYKTIVEHQYPLPNFTNKKEENAKLWTENQGQIIKVALDESIKEVIKKLNKELQNPSKVKY